VGFVGRKKTKNQGEERHTEPGFKHGGIHKKEWLGYSFDEILKKGGENMLIFVSKEGGAHYLTTFWERIDRAMACICIKKKIQRPLYQNHNIWAWDSKCHRKKIKGN